MNSDGHISCPECDKVYLYKTCFENHYAKVHPKVVESEKKNRRSLSEAALASNPECEDEDDEDDLSVFCGGEDGDEEDEDESEKELEGMCMDCIAKLPAKKYCIHLHIGN